MSKNPFAADPAVPARMAQLAADSGPGITAEIGALARHGALGPLEVETLVSRYSLNVEELMLLALPVAQKLAMPPVSGFFVGAVGLERETGGLLFGGNLEFPGAPLGFTVHGEGFVFTRAFHRGTSIAKIAIGEAHPCAHCRQYLSEFAASADLLLIDPLGHRLSLADLYPWPFDPAYLGDPGIVAGAIPWPDLDLAPHELPDAVAAALAECGRRSHAPYSRCPAAVVLTLGDGTLVAGAAIESVAFNPTMAPLPAALIELRALGRTHADIASATLATRLGGNVDYAQSTIELLARIAPGVPLAVAGWR